MIQLSIKLVPHPRGLISPGRRKCVLVAAGRLSTFSIAIVFAVISAAWLLTRGVQAQEDLPAETGIFRTENLEMTVRAGFGRLEVSNWMGSWVPFRISLTNQGPPITGRLIVHCESSPNPTAQVREYVKEIQLPTGSRQLHEIAAYLNSNQSPVVRLQSAGRVIAEASVRVDRTYGMSDQLEIGVIDRDSTSLNNISSTEILRAPGRAPFKSATTGVVTPVLDPDAPPLMSGQPPPPSGQARRRPGGPSVGRPVFLAHPIVIAPEDLPHEFISFDQLDAVVIGDAPLNQLSEEQARALKLWVASGGLLIITGAADVPGLRAVGLEAISPVEPKGTASSASLPELNEVYGSFDSLDRLSFLSARLKPEARVLIGGADAPLVAERTYGSGLVRFVAINPKLNPYRAWSASKDLWVDLLIPAAEPKPKHTNWITFGRRSNSSSNRWGVQGFLFRLAEIAPPSPRYVLLFLLAYVLALGPINYAVLRWKRKTDLAWLTIPAVVISFAIVSVVVAQIGRGGASIVADASLVEVHQRDGISRVTTGLLMMPTAKRTQELSFSGRDVYASDVYNGNQSSSASAIGSIECERGTNQFVLRVPMTTWTSGLFQIRSISDNAPPMVSATDVESGITIRNLSETRIGRVVYLSSAGVSDPFELDAASEQRISVTAAQPLSFNSWYLTKLGQGAEEEELFQEVGPLLDREIGGDPAVTHGFFDKQSMTESLKQLRRPLLIGFVERGAAIGFQGSFRRTSKALYVIHL
ncbi:MAG TPA: hypothetical protein VLM38_23965 [Blastocatellia bacterium]|nr:hypothetical protein [Blastocatellia bacterium]